MPSAQGGRSAAVSPAADVGAAALGIRGVPVFVLDRAYGVSGAQPGDALLVAPTARRRTTR